MLDREGFRPNVGIVLLNARNEVFWGKRLREHSWQFPQGGIKFGETPVQAMYRELHEEVGLKPEHVKVIGRTRDWLRYEVPDKFIRREVRGHYRGQKQIWFLLRMVARDCDICLRATTHPEFDAWRWNSYWVPLDAVIEFKRDVYQLALTELSRFVRRAQARHDDVGADDHGALDDHGARCEPHGSAAYDTDASRYDEHAESSCDHHGPLACHGHDAHDAASCDTRVLVAHASVLTFTLSSASSAASHAEDERPEPIVPIAHK